MIAKQPKPKKCKNPACGVSFPPRRLGQVVCSPACAVALVPVKREQERKSLAQLERRAIKAAKERIKSRSQHMKEAQVAFNAWVRLRDAGLPCVSCGRHHNGQWHAGHYRTVGGSPELRFEPLNVWRQCAPCNNHQSGNIVNYRIELVKRIGEEKVAWLEGPHQPRKYTIEELKTIKAEYRAKARELKRAAA
ncbi:recombination protein NinG [Pseudomonas fluorescens]|uniref:recombination protein NinG n=1 Tax=Pseudomonas fluorescens TaxID=294 RepID=UPI0004BE3EE6|nr:recombination protein NinG [Pseudomonas fluorescens]